MKIFMSLLAKTTLSLFFLGGLFSCEKENVPVEESEPLNASINAMNTVKITSTGMNFDAPDEIPSGWNTFEYTNGTSAPHFFLLVKIPDTITLEEYRQEVTVPFNEWLWELVDDPLAAPTLPKWFAEATNYGGSGIVSPGETAVTSMNLPSGNYIIECYIKMPGSHAEMIDELSEKPGGIFHSFPVNGMLKQLTVTTDETKEKKPRPTITIDVTREGFVHDNDIQRPGMHTFAVEFENRKGDLFIPDVHLVRLDEGNGADIGELNSWMHWINNLGEEDEGLMTPAPAGFTFLGGSQELTKGGTTYFQANLKPGSYALISEYPDSKTGKYLYDFSVGPKGK